MHTVNQTNMSTNQFVDVEGIRNGSNADEQNNPTQVSPQALLTSEITPTITSPIPPHQRQHMRFLHPQAMQHQHYHHQQPQHFQPSHCHHMTPTPICSACHVGMIPTAWHCPFTAPVTAHQIVHPAFESSSQYAPIPTDDVRHDVASAGHPTNATVVECVADVSTANASPTVEDSVQHADGAAECQQSPIETNNCTHQPMEEQQQQLQANYYQQDPKPEKPISQHQAAHVEPPPESHQRQPLLTNAPTFHRQLRNGLSDSYLPHRAANSAVVGHSASAHAVQPPDAIVRNSMEHVERIATAQQLFHRDFNSELKSGFYDRKSNGLDPGYVRLQRREPSATVSKDVPVEKPSMGDGDAGMVYAFRLMIQMHIACTIIDEHAFV